MPEKSPESYSLITYSWVIALAILGGIVSFIRKMQLGQARIFNIVELIGEIVTSAFAGILTFWLCEASHFDPLITAALVGVSGHMGSRAIFALENWLKSRLIP